MAVFTKLWHCLSCSFEKNVLCIYMVKEMTRIDVQRHNTHVVTVFLLLNCQLYFCLFIVPASLIDINLEIVGAGQIFSVMGH